MYEEQIKQPLEDCSISRLLRGSYFSNQVPGCHITTYTHNYQASQINVRLLHYVNVAAPSYLAKDGLLWQFFQKLQSTGTMTRYTSGPGIRTFAVPGPTVLTTQPLLLHDPKIPYESYNNNNNIQLNQIFTQLQLIYRWQQTDLGDRKLGCVAAKTIGPNQVKSFNYLHINSLYLKNFNLKEICL